MPHFFTEKNQARQMWHARFNSTERYQTVMKNYYRMANEVDATSHVLVQELEKQGVLNNTLVIFTTDNGYFHSEHGLANKQYPHQESIRVPLIIRDPRMPPEKKGTVNDDFTLSIDLAPTLLSAAGISPPKRVQGRDISELYRGEMAQSLRANPWRTEFYYEFPGVNRRPPEEACPCEALVRKDFKLMNWTFHGQEQLFHLEKDPWELDDVIAKETQHGEVLAQMRQRLQELREAAK